MKVPEEIRKIERPVNTYVVAYKTKKGTTYYVRSHKGCRYDKGRRLPISGPTVGYIINNKYVPKVDHSLNQYELKNWGEIELCDQQFNFILDDLYKHFSVKDALKIYCIALLRICNPGIKDYELLDAYDTSFLSNKYPNIGLSKNSISTFLKSLGSNLPSILNFMKERASKINNADQIIIDGTLKTNDSTENSLSNYSRKSKLKNRKDISILWAYNLTQKELVCSHCYPGNMIDYTAYSDFVSKNDIKSGIIISDKGLPENAAKEWFKENNGLHYLYPLKRNSLLIKKYKLLNFSTALKNADGVFCKKVEYQITNKDTKETTTRYLYAFRDTNLVYSEEYALVERSKKKDNLTEEKYTKLQQELGTIVFESDLDLTCEEVFLMYGSRWEIEIVLRYYKEACDFNDTRVHKDCSVYGSEFCNFLASVCTIKLINLFAENGLFETRNYKQIMKIFKRAQRLKCDKSWSLIKMNPSDVIVLNKFGLTTESIDA